MVEKLRPWNNLWPYLQTISKLLGAQELMGDCALLNIEKYQKALKVGSRPLIYISRLLLRMIVKKVDKIHTFFFS